MQESYTTMVPITVPILVPSESLIEQFSENFPPMYKFLVDNGKITSEELISYLQFRVMMTEVAGSMDEFVALYKSVKEAAKRKESNLVLPQGY